MDLFQLRKLFFEFNQVFGLIVEIGRAFGIAMEVSTVFKRPIIDHATCLEIILKALFLRSSRLKFELVGF